MQINLNSTEITYRRVQPKKKHPVQEELGCLCILLLHAIRIDRENSTIPRQALDYYRVGLRAERQEKKIESCSPRRDDGFSKTYCAEIFERFPFPYTSGAPAFDPHSNCLRLTIVRLYQISPFGSGHSSVFCVYHVASFVFQFCHRSSGNWEF